MGVSEELSLGERKAVETELEKRKEEASFMGWVERKEKGSKAEKRILVICKSRLFTIFKAKLEKEIFFLELSEIKSDKPDAVTFKFGKSWEVEILSPSVDNILNGVILAYEHSFHGMPAQLKYKLEVKPESRIRELPGVEHPLGGFIPTFETLCDYHGIPKSGDIIWDLENLYSLGNIKDLNLNDFEQPMPPKLMAALLGALQFNGYFRGLSASNIQLKDHIPALAECLKTNVGLESISFVDCGLDPKNFTVLGEALASNKNLNLSKIDLSNNKLDDKCIDKLASYISGVKRGISKIDLSNCNLGKVGTSSLFRSISKNSYMASSLIHLDVSGNKLESEGCQTLSAFLKAPNQLQILNLKNSAAALNLIVGSIRYGCQELSELDLSGNKFSRNESRDLVQLVQSSNKLGYLSLEGTGAPVESVKEILETLGKNLYLSELSINLGGNKLGLGGARAIAGLAEKGIPNITKLNLSDNDFGDEGVAILAEAFCTNSSLKYLNLGANFKGKPTPQQRQAALQNLSNLIEKSAIESLNISGGSGSELKIDILFFLYELPTNETLTSLDISGHQFGNKGASALAKVVQINTTLTSLRWDNNGTTWEGFDSFANALKRNKTLKNMSLPIIDITAAMKDTKRTKQLLDSVRHIEKLLARNQNPAARFESSESKGNASSFSFFTSPARNEVSNQVLKVKSTGKKAPNTAVLEDAENSDQLMTEIFNIKDGIQQELQRDLNKFMGKTVQDIVPIIEHRRGQMIDTLVNAVEKRAKTLNQDQIKLLKTNIQWGATSFDEENAQKILVKQTGTEIIARAGDVLHSTVTIASDYIYEKFLENLKDLYEDILNPTEKQPTPTSSGTPSPTPERLINRDQKKPPIPPSAKNKPSVRNAEPPKASSVKQSDLTDVKESKNIVKDVRKDRVAQQGKKPPSRRKRPAPVQVSQM